MARQPLAWWQSGDYLPPLLQNSEYRSPADPEFHRDLLRLHPLAPQLDYLASLPPRRRDPPAILPFGLGSRHALALPLQHDLPLELREGPHQVQYELPGGCRGVECHSEDLQFDSLGLEFRG